MAMVGLLERLPLPCAGQCLHSTFKQLMSSAKQTRRGCLSPGTRQNPSISQRSKASLNPGTKMLTCVSKFSIRKGSKQLPAQTQVWVYACLACRQPHGITTPNKYAWPPLPVIPASGRQGPENQKLYFILSIMANWRLGRDM